VENLHYEIDDIVVEALDHFIEEGVIPSTDTVIFPRRGAPDTTWEALISALVSTEDTTEAAIILGFGISGFAKNPEAPKKGFQSAQYKSKLNKTLGKSGYKNWKTWFCNKIGVHYCQSCECYHPLEAFALLKRGSKTQREPEYRHMCIETYNKDYQQKYVKAYHKRNPHLKKEGSARRRAKIQSRAVEAEIADIIEFYRNCPEGYQVDHWMPLALGGLHSISNLVYLPAKENLRKSCLHPDAWIKRRAELVSAGILDEDQKNNT